MAEHTFNKNLVKVLTETNRVVRQVVDSLTEVVEVSPVVKKASWEELAARGQRLADKWAESRPKTELKGTIDQLRTTIESQIELMPHKAKTGTLRALSNLAGVVDDLQNLGHHLDASPDPGATLCAHGMRQVVGPMERRRAAGTSVDTHSSVGARRRMHRAWLLDENA